MRKMPLWYLNLPIFVCASVDQSFIANGGEGGDGGRRWSERGSRSENRIYIGRLTVGDPVGLCSRKLGTFISQISESGLA